MLFMKPGLLLATGFAGAFAAPGSQVPRAGNSPASWGAEWAASQTANAGSQDTSSWGDAWAASQRKAQSDSSNGNPSPSVNAGISVSVGIGATATPDAGNSASASVAPSGSSDAANSGATGASSGDASNMLTHNVADCPTDNNGGDDQWLAPSPDYPFSTAKFGKSTASSGEGVSYKGNVGEPYGSNIVPLSKAEAREYQYVARFYGSKHSDTNLKIWNKMGPDGKMSGWFTKFASSCTTLTIPKGGVQHVAFAADTQGGWTYSTTHDFPTDWVGEWMNTWGEFDTGSHINKGHSGFDVSAIKAMKAGWSGFGGMKIYNVGSASRNCSMITSSKGFYNAYRGSDEYVDGMGGSIEPGPVRLVVHLDYQG
ncbi:allergen Asp F4 precursor [Penicillium capsulatum]|uniref:Allergen Asp F4 n=1 Tax=Penicillium capsulatum TaxID=69766 RepID=A0A9W9LWI5_9EURO|nr:allergen Asp F4 precursor [Penicillium capsulatum]KAJ6122869.1 allergen Asp F4 precursor [Penicillium capsulatum]